MIRKKMFRIMALMILLVLAVAGRAQNSCTYTIQLSDNMSNRFYGGKVVVYDSLGTAVDTVYFRDDYQQSDWHLDYQFTAAPGTYHLGYYATESISDSYWDYLSVSVMDADGIEVSYTYGMELMNGQPYFSTFQMMCNDCHAVNNLQISNIDSTSATISWDLPQGDAVSFSISVIGGNNGQYGVIAYQGSVTGSQVTVTGMQPMTYYNVYVQTACSSGDSSGVRRTAFTTKQRKLQIIYVKQGSYGDGSSWSNAYGRISQAVTEYNNQYTLYDNSPMIWVAGGTYTANYINARPKMRMYGGFAGNESELTDISLRNNPTILDGDGTGYVLYSAQDLTASTACLFDGLTLTNAPIGAYLSGWVTLKNCTIEGCTQRGVYVKGVSGNRNLALQNCRIVNNVSSMGARGAGVYAQNVIIENCLIANNIVTNAYCGGLYSVGNVTVRHCDIVGNRGENYGGYYSAANDTVQGCIVWGNKSTTGAPDLLAYNSVFQYNALSATVNGPGNIVLAYSNSGEAPDSNYVRFVNPDAGDWRLNAGSACINACSIYYGPSTDLVGAPRPHGSAPDMGCLESDGSVICISPIGITAAAGTNSATITWNSGGNTHFQLQWAEGDGEWSQTIELDGNTYTLTDLNEYSLYKIRVRALCANNYTDWSDVYQFRTSCDNPIAAVQAGLGESYSNMSLPISTSYPYSQGFILYTAEELGPYSRSIDSIGLYTSSVDTRILTIRVMQTNLQNLSWSAVNGLESQMPVLYEGPFTFSGNPDLIPLQTPIQYDGVSNLLVCITDTTGVSGNYSSFNCSYSSINTLFTYGDDRDHVMYYSSSNYRPVAYFSGTCDLSPCPRPMMNVSSVSESSVALAFQRLRGNALITLRRLSDGAVTHLDNLRIVDSLYTIYDLSPNSSYEIAIRSVCSSGDTSETVTTRFTTLPGRSSVLYVKQNANGSADGSSWENAFTNLNDALRIANTIHQMYGIRVNVLVAEGYYYGNTSLSYAFAPVDGVDLYGGFAGNEEYNDSIIANRDLQMHNTVLSGQYMQTVIWQEDDFEEGCRWDGFTLESGISWSSNPGGAGLRRGFTLSNCKVNFCQSQDGPGGIEMHHATVENCEISYCEAYATDAGGIFSDQSTIRNVIVKNCSSSSGPGGIIMFYGLLENSLIYANNSSSVAGVKAMYGKVRNCDIVGNNATDFSAVAGLYYYNENEAPQGCIIWGNTNSSGDAIQVSGCDSLILCAVEGGYNGSSNLTLSPFNDGNDPDVVYPRFDYPEYGSYRLGFDSPLIDAGISSSQASSYTSLDLDGNPRVFNDIMDIGCYEYSDPWLCLRPIQPSVMVMGSAAQVSWTMPENVFGVEIEYKALDDPDWTVISEYDVNRYMITGLPSDSDFILRLRSNCYSNYSDYTRTISFSNRCVPSMQVGDDYPSISRSSLPIEMRYGYSYSQQIFLPSEVGPARAINGIALQYLGDPVTRYVKIYMGHKDSLFAYTQNYVSYSTGGLQFGQLTLLYDDWLSFSNSDSWMEIPFQNSFVYNGSDNLVLVMVDNSDIYTYEDFYFGCNSQNFCTTISGHSDYEITDETLVSGYASSVRSNVKFLSDCNQTCQPPLFTLNEISDSSALFSCQADYFGSSVFEYRPLDDPYWNTLTPYEDFYVGGLYHNTDYLARLANVCAPGDTSEWNTIHFRTPLRRQSRFYVSESGTPWDDARSWYSASNDLAATLATAGEVHRLYGDTVEVWVALGEYHGNFVIPAGVFVYGGFLGDEGSDFDLSQRQLDIYHSVLNGDNMGRVLTQERSFGRHHESLWDGFEIINGYSDESGGGVLLLGNVTLRNSSVRYCTSEDHGGGVRSVRSRLENVEVRECFSSNDGGGISSSTSYIADCDVYRCAVRSTEKRYGGGINSSADSIVRCRIYDDSSNYAGAIYSDNSYIENCLFWRNVSDTIPVLCANSKLVHCDIVGNRNTGSVKGCAVNGTNARLYGCVVWGNKDHNGEPIPIGARVNSVTYSAVEGGYEGSGNITLQSDNFGTEGYFPQFANPSSGDFRPISTSPLVDAGNPSLSLASSVDIQGRPRLYGNAVDMGCFEFNGESICVVPNPVTVAAGRTSAVVTWAESADATSSQVRYKLRRDVDWTILPPVSGNHYMISGLMPDSSYMVSVRNLCGEEESSWSSAVNFSTRCNSEVTPISGTSFSMSYDVPFQTSMKFGYSQQIYLQSEMGNAAQLHALRISFQKALEGLTSRNIQVYLAHTNQSDFDADTNSLPADIFTKVYQGNINFNYVASNPSSFVDIPFDIPFDYNGRDNLVVAVINYSGQNEDGVNFSSHQTGDHYRSICSKNDDLSYNITGTYALRPTYSRNSFTFLTLCDNGSCLMPMVSAVDITSSSARLLCETSGSTTLQLQYRNADSNDWISLVPAPEVTLNGLGQYTDYQIRIRSICGNGDTSEWRTTMFRTHPRQQSHFYVAQQSRGRADGSSWADATGDLNRVLQVAHYLYRNYQFHADIWVEHGIYYGDYTFVPGVSVYGGFAGNEPDDYNLDNRDFNTNTSIIDAQNRVAVINQVSALTPSSAVVWDGFTMQNSNGPITIEENGTLRNVTLHRCISIDTGHALVSLIGGHLYNCTIENDSSAKEILSVSRQGVAENCLIANNTCESSVVMLRTGSLIGNTIVSNLTRSSETNVALQIYRDVYDHYWGNIYNTILWGNCNRFANVDFVQTNISIPGIMFNCAVEGDVVNDTTSKNIALSHDNISSVYSPHFVNPTTGAGNAYANGDWRLAEGSFCINAASQGYSTLSVDLSNSPRLQSGAVDIGCFESPYSATSMPDYSSGIVYVKPIACGNADGSSWDNALDDINIAQQVASSNGMSTVWVAQGVYHGGFHITRGVNVYGGFEGNEPASAPLSGRDFINHASILDGGGIIRPLTQLVTLYPRDSVLWDGFTLYHGHTNSDGGGVYLTGYVTLDNCRILSNYADNQGGGVWMMNSKLYRCVIEGNHSQNDAGGVYMTDNSVVENCLIANNQSEQSNVAGVFTTRRSIMRGNTIVANASNSTLDPVYGVYVLYHYDNQVFDNTIVLFTHYFYNNIIWGNRSLHQYGTALQINNVDDCIFVGNAVEGGVTARNNYALSYDNNANFVGPHFVNPTAAGYTHTDGDWHLSDGSLCIERANSANVMLLTDVEGNPRFANGFADLGCYQSSYDKLTYPLYPDSIVYVKSSPSGNADGTSWSNAMGDINQAQNIAYNTRLSKVWVAQGVYHGDSIGANEFSFVPYVSVYGGFSGSEPANYDISQRDFENNATVLDAENRHRVLCQLQNYSLASRAEWNGFSITRGVVGDSTFGAGVYLRGFGTLANCKVYDNNNYNYYGLGGGIYVQGSPHPVFHRDQTFLDNCDTVYSTQIINCSVYGNTSINEGAGISVNGDRTLISGCLVTGNTNSSYHVAGVYMNGCNRIVYSTIAGNTNSWSSIPNAAGLKICNSVKSYTDTATVSNSIIWGNKNLHYDCNIANSFGARFVNCALGDTVYPGNIYLSNRNDGSAAGSVYPRFTDPSAGDFSLHPTSMLIDRGNNDDLKYLQPTDLVGNPRINGIVDLGCLEAVTDTNCLPPTALTSNTVSSSTANVSWTPMGSETSWQVRIRKEGSQVDTIISVSSTPTVGLTSLDFNRTYIVSARAICGVDATSIWSVPLVFSTLCDTTLLQPLPQFAQLTPSNGYVAFDERVSFNWNAMAEASSYDLYFWYKSDTTGAQPVATGLSEPALNNYSLPMLYRHREDTCLWYVVAHNECISRPSDTMFFVVNGIPDLHVSNFTISAPVAGRTAHIEWTVTNDGSGATHPGHHWFDYIYINTMPNVSGGYIDMINATSQEVLLDTLANLRSLNPGESYTNSTTITIPETFIGDKFIIVLTDQKSADAWNYYTLGLDSLPIPYTPSADGIPYPYLSSSSEITRGLYINSRIPERNDYDNFFYQYVNIIPAPTPDLKVVDVQHPMNSFSNDTIKVYWQTRNQGDAAAVTSGWTDAIYISDNELFSSGNSTLLGTVRHEGMLNVGMTTSDSASLIIPLELSGTYWIHVLTNISNDVDESLFSANNTYTSTQPINIIMAPPPDLALDSLGNFPDTVFSQSSHAFYYRVKNVGAKPVPQTRWTDVAYLSSSTTLNLNTAYRVGSVNINRSLGVDSSYTATMTITIPDGFEGLRYLFIITDVNDAVFEYTFEDNNRMMRTTPILVTLPDLAAHWLSLPDTVDINEPFRVSWVVRNVGSADLVNRTIEDRILLGDEKVFSLGHSAFSLAAGDSIINVATIKMPCTTESLNRLRIVTDYVGSVYENEEMNNADTSKSIVTLAPDLSTSCLSTSELWSGQPTMFRWSLMNHGTVAIDRDVTDLFFLCSSELTTTSDTIILGRYTRSVSLAPGETIVDSVKLTIPEGVFGNKVVHHLTNYSPTDSISSTHFCEGADADSNHSVSDMTINLSPYPDLRITSVDIRQNTDNPSSMPTLNIGEPFNIGYTLKNEGTGNLVETDVKTAFYISSHDVFDIRESRLIGNDFQNISIDRDSSLSLSMTFLLPNVAAGLYYIHAITDIDNDIYEYDGEDNNMTRSAHLMVQQYMLDLVAGSITGPTDVRWDSPYTFTMTVTNNSQLPTLESGWQDELYISDDEYLDANDIRIATFIRYGTLQAGESYTSTFEATIPMGTSANAYLFAVVDYRGENSEVDYSNNTATKALSVQSIPTPDLELSDVEITSGTPTSGQPMTVRYRTTNIGETDIEGKQWFNKFYLSFDTVIDRQDLEIASSYNMSVYLAVGQSLIDSVEVQVPLPIQGDLYLIGCLNSSKSFYEISRVNNVVALPMNVVLPNPGDLVVRDINSEDSVVSGHELHIDWNVKNVGENVLNGWGLRSVVYISVDSLFDVTDRMLGTVDLFDVTDRLSGTVDERSRILLPPGGELHQQLNSRISAIPEGDYYLIVKTDVRNVFYEDDEANNSSASAYTVAVKVRNLLFDNPLNDTLINDLANDYRLDIGDNRGETVRVHLDSEDTSSGAVNSIYLLHNNVGNDLNYNFSTFGQSVYNPEIYIPYALPGYYGVSVIGSTPTAESQNITIEANILPFELRSVDPIEGGNTGFVTVELTGSHFRPDMQVWMTKDTIRLTPDTIIYDSYYHAFARFNLKGVDTGRYDVGVLNYCEGEAVLQNGFRVIKGTAEKLTYQTIIAEYNRFFRGIVLLTLEYANVGTNDIVDPVLEVSSMGQPLSLSPDMEYN